MIKVRDTKSSQEHEYTDMKMFSNENDTTEFITKIQSYQKISHMIHPNNMKTSRTLLHIEDNQNTNSYYLGWFNKGLKNAKWNLDNDIPTFSYDSFRYSVMIVLENPAHTPRMYIVCNKGQPSESEKELSMTKVLDDYECEFYKIDNNYVKGPISIRVEYDQPINADALANATGCLRLQKQMII